MHILFLDESGTPPKPGKRYPQYFVVGGVIIPENVWHSLRDALLGLKARKRIRGEFKWRYFAPNNHEPRNPMRHLEQEERNAIRSELYQIICGESGVRSIAAVCSVSAAYGMPSVSTQDDIYHLTYKVATERFQYHLQDLSKEVGHPVRGVVVADHRGPDDDKQLRAHHQKLLHSGAEFISQYKNLIESLFLQSSVLSVGVQLADMIAGAVWRKYERSDERWYEALEPSLRRGPRNQVAGYGIVKVPKRGWI